MEIKEESKDIYSTPKPLKVRHEKINSSFESPYLQKKEEIDEIINKRYFDLNQLAVKKCIGFNFLSSIDDHERSVDKPRNPPANKFKKLRVPHFGKHNEKRKRNQPQRLK